MKILIAVLLCFPFAGISQTFISGIATHGFSANAAKKPDAGAKIFVFTYEGDAADIYETINKFLIAKSFRVLNEDVDRLIGIYKDSAALIKGKRAYEKEYAAFQNKIAEIRSATAERNAKLKGWNAESNAGFDVLDQQAAKALSLAKMRAGDRRTIADAAGNFTIKVPPANYVVLIISENRTGFSSAEVSGKIFLTTAEVKDGETKNVSAYFFPD